MCLRKWRRTTKFFPRLFTIDIDSQFNFLYKPQTATVTHSAALLFLSVWMSALFLGLRWDRRWMRVHTEVEVDLRRISTDIIRIWGSHGLRRERCVSCVSSEEAREAVPKKKIRERENSSKNNIILKRSCFACVWRIASRSTLLIRCHIHLFYNKWPLLCIFIMYLIKNKVGRWCHNIFSFVGSFPL